MKDHVVSPIALTFMERNHRGKVFVQPKYHRVLLPVSLTRCSLSSVCVTLPFCVSVQPLHSLAIYLALYT